MNMTAYDQLRARNPGFKGAGTNAATVETCRSELCGVLEEWLILKLCDPDPIPK